MATKVLICVCLLLPTFNLKAQDTTLLHLLEDSLTTQKTYTVKGTFKATQIINTPTIEAPARKTLQFMIMHRFGKINEGAYALFGLDNATIRFALDYGLTDRLSIGIGRSSLEKVYDASFKWAIFRQKENGLPLAISLYSIITNTTLKYSSKPYLNTKYRTLYTTQLLMARKFNPSLSLQLTPSWIHLNLVPTPLDKNDLFALGFGGRLKLTKRISLNGEYNYLADAGVVSSKVYNSIAAGVDIETGGHVFQFIFTNSGGMTAPYYLAKTTGDWGRGDVYFGFNITRIFSFKK